MPASRPVSRAIFPTASHAAHTVSGVNGTDHSGSGFGQVHSIAAELARTAASLIVQDSWKIGT